MREKFLELLKERGEILATSFLELMPETKGEYTAYMPVSYGVNQKIIWFVDVNHDFIEMFNQLLVKEKIIEWFAVDLWCYLADGAPIVKGVPVAEKKHIKGKKECWLPIAIKLK